MIAAWNRRALASSPPAEGSGGSDARFVAQSEHIHAIQQWSLDNEASKATIEARDKRIAELERDILDRNARIVERDARISELTERITANAAVADETIRRERAAWDTEVRELRRELEAAKRPPFLDPGFAVVSHDALKRHLDTIASLESRLAAMQAVVDAARSVVEGSLYQMNSGYVRSRTSALAEALKVLATLPAADAEARLCERPGCVAIASWQQGHGADGVLVLCEKHHAAAVASEAPPGPPEPPWERIAGIAAENMARRFHEAYERLAPTFGYVTRPESNVAWDRVPEKNRLLMTAVCAELMGLFPAADAEATGSGDTVCKSCGDAPCNGCQLCGGVSHDCPHMRMAREVADPAIPPTPASDGADARMCPQCGAMAGQACGCYARRLAATDSAASPATHPVSDSAEAVTGTVGRTATGEDGGAHPVAPAGDSDDSKGGDAYALAEGRSGRRGDQVAAARTPHPQAAGGHVRDCCCVDCKANRLADSAHGWPRVMAPDPLRGSPVTRAEVERIVEEGVRRERLWFADVCDALARQMNGSLRYLLAELAKAIRAAATAGGKD